MIVRDPGHHIHDIEPLLPFRGRALRRPTCPSKKFIPFITCFERLDHVLRNRPLRRRRACSQFPIAAMSKANAIFRSCRFRPTARCARSWPDSVSRKFAAEGPLGGQRMGGVQRMDEHITICSSLARFPSLDEFRHNRIRCVPWCASFRPGAAIAGRLAR
jgi:hypothetical protein